VKILHKTAIALAASSLFATVVAPVAEVSEVSPVTANNNHCE